ncbi:hypothetical protein [Nonlabens marinus]|uniref:Uncharacterized protein n=1 Tax=Nonlabens marinus S1-08 TaxID=1454201 RepID=W8VS13_9FLAO|nr:hypothetical protein [Nonlabens marinus]BAO55945.1 hypothetical protein NMS_1936 [Nonlabens marinus S1-08]
MNRVIILLLLSSSICVAQIDLDLPMKVNKISFENPSRDSFEDCRTLNIHHQLKTVVNIGNDYSIEVPENWEVFENLVPETPGIIISLEHDGMSDLIGVVEVEKENVDLEKYFTQELTSLWFGSSSEEWTYVEAGIGHIGEKETYWLHEESIVETELIQNIFYYVEGNSKTQVFLVNMALIGPKINVRERFCNLRRWLETFQIR